MVTEEYNNYIFEYKIGLQTIKDIYIGLYNRYFIEEKNELNRNAVSSKEPIDRKNESIKIHYMVVVIMWSNLEGLLSNIRSIKNYKDKTKLLATTSLCTNDELLNQIYLIRDCIMHSHGDVSKFRTRNIKLKMLDIDIKYINKRDNKIALSESDMTDFFFLLENKILDMVQNITKK
jgi:hypothetical protein